MYIVGNAENAWFIQTVATRSNKASDEQTERVKKTHNYEY